MALNTNVASTLHNSSDNHPIQQTSGSTPPLFPILSSGQVLKSLDTIMHAKPYYAMYNSLYAGIVTDPALMILPLDDHMVHRGHAVFDTVNVTEGYMYNLDAHLDRFFNSASIMGILHQESNTTTNVFTRGFVKAAILATVLAGQHPTCAVRYWLSVGPGDFSFSAKGCPTPCLIVIASAGLSVPSGKSLQEATISTDIVGMNALPLTAAKTPNYALNVLLHLEAKKKGGYFGIWVDKRTGLVKESCIAGLLVFTKERHVLSPPLIDTLASCTVARSLQVCQAKGIQYFPVVERREITLEDLFNANEVILCGGETHFYNVTAIDGRPIGYTTTTDNNQEDPMKKEGCCCCEISLFEFLVTNSMLEAVGKGEFLTPSLCENIFP